MSLKIIGGQFRGRPLKSPPLTSGKGEGTRPTLAIMRKSVFDIVQTAIQDAEFLDLYAGSGAMGLEALSRGAKHATFVEQNPRALKCIEENSRLLGVQEQCTILGYPIFRALKMVAKRKERYDLVYIDPPYAAVTIELLKEILLFFDTDSLLSPGGTLFVETAVDTEIDTKRLNLGRIHYRDRRTFSGSALHQFYAFLP